MRKLLIALLMVPALALAGEGELHLDKAPDRSANPAALQNGAKLFVNYCLNCHSASYMRYNRLKDLGLTDKQIEGNLMFTADKVGELMRVAMQRQDAEVMFGMAPPDLTLIARAKSSEAGSGTDWIYTYLRGFYRDDSRPSGWNNTVFPNVGMPHVLWELQGSRDLTVKEVKEVQDKTDTSKVVGYEEVTTVFDQSGASTRKVEKLEGMSHHPGIEYEWGEAKGGKMSPGDYDMAIGDLVGYLKYMGEPVAEYRKLLGMLVLVGLLTLFVFAYALKKEYWKDVH